MWCNVRAQLYFPWFSDYVLPIPSTNQSVPSCLPWCYFCYNSNSQINSIFFWVAPELALKCFLILWFLIILWFFNSMVPYLTGEVISLCSSVSNELRYFFDIFSYENSGEGLLCSLKKYAAIIIGILLNLFVDWIGQTDAFTLLVFLPMNIIYFHFILPFF